MELVTDKDFKDNVNKEVYVVQYSDKIEEGILPFADNIACNPKFKAEDLFSKVPEPSGTILTCEDLVTDYFIICTYSVDLDNIHFATYIAHYNFNDRSVRTSQIVDNNIHIFTTKEECQEYINKCNETILYNLLSFYEVKLNQYTSTVKKLTKYFKNYETK